MSLSLEKRNLFEKLLEDNTHGSSHILRKTVEILKDVPSGEQAGYIKMLCEAHKGMAYLINLKKFVETQKKGCEEFYEEVKKAQSEVLERFESYLESVEIKTVFTLSYSAAVRDALLKIKDKRFEVWVGESRPALEGIKFAEHLFNSGFKNITVMTDANLLSSVSKADLIILGCDAFTDSFFVNKTGSRALCLLGERFGVKTIVLADRFKKIEAKDVVFKEGAPDEIYCGKAKLNVENPYFEMVYFTENVIIFY